MTGITPSASYNLFRRIESELFCAVPENRPVPAFLDAVNWEFSGTVSEAGPWPIGFKADAARLAERFNGFYVFQGVGPSGGPRRPAPD